MSLKKHGGKRKGAGRKKSTIEKKTIQIRVPVELHCELKEICKMAIKKYLK